MITLKKNPDRDFTVLNLTDPQLIIHDWAEGHINRRILEYTVEKLVKKICPDLITVSGDISAAEYPEAYTNFANLVDKYDVPWTVAWGNHDNQGGAETIKKYVSEYKTYKNFVYESGDEALGNGNFVIAIEENGKTVHGIIMMDTHDRMPLVDEKGNETMDWAKLIPEQLTWYEGVVKALWQKGCNETTIISHIPIYAYRDAYAAAFNSQYDAEKLTFEDTLSGKCWNKDYEDSFGINHEGICSYSKDEGMFDLICKLGSTKLYLCGHDHVNNSCIKYNGVRLMYGLKTGRGCYYRPGMNGGTVLKINSAGNVEAKHEFCDEGV